MMDLSKYSTGQVPTWCPGCGNYAILQSLKQALGELNLSPKDTVVTYDIGCGGNMINVLRVCGFATLHGRSVPVAVGAKLANPRLTVIAQAGDGGLLNEGTNHLIHAARRDDDITVLLVNNLVFALTTGQASYATPQGLTTKSTPQGNPTPPINALLLAAAAGAGFLSRAYAFDVQQTTAIIKEAIKHPGFSLVEIVMPCLVWSEPYDPAYFKKKVFYVKEAAGSKSELLSFLSAGRKKIPLGIFWGK